VGWAGGTIGQHDQPGIGVLCQPRFHGRARGQIGSLRYIAPDKCSVVLWLFPFLTDRNSMADQARFTGPASMIVWQLMVLVSLTVVAAQAVSTSA
jgi:hypothetical protein